MEKDDANELIHEVRVGRVRAQIWLSRTDPSAPTYEVTVVRSHPEAEAGASMNDTPALLRDDLLLAAKALDVAHSFICRMERNREGAGA